MRRQKSVRALVAAAVLAGLIPLAAPAVAVDGASSPVFMNEFHYDNTGADVGEFIEVAGPAGTDLTGWSIVLYNGNGGASYGTIILSGILADQQGGYGTASFAAAGIQNGAPDGMALIDPAAAVVQFLSYEGGFTASNGPAAGQTSTDVGVSEPGSDPVGLSLQLTGTGTTAGEFGWTGPVAQSPGAPNDGQTFEGGATPIRINEIRIDQDGADNDEYFELIGPAGTSLDGLTYLVIGDGVGGSGVIEEVTDLTGQVIAPDGLFLVAEATFTLGAADLVGDVNFENSDNVTHLLVEGFTGLDGDDLDSNDDGALDLSPWTSELDRIALVEEENPPTGTEFHYGPPSIGPDGTFVPGHVYRCSDGFRIGVFAPLGATDTAGEPNDTCNAPDVTPIHTIQGSVPANDPDVATPFPSAGDPVDDSPLLGQLVTVEGIVSGWDDLAGQSNAGNIFHNDRGIFVQEEDGDADTDNTTSEGIFVQFANASDDVADYQPGDLVRVGGVVAEHFELTVIASGATIEVISSGNPLPTPVVIDASTAGRDRYEQLEGMRVELAEGVANSGGTNRFGELFLTPGPAKDILVRPDGNDGLLALLGDAGAGNPAIPRKPEVPSTTVVKADLFDTVLGSVGPMTYTFDFYKITMQPGALPTVVDDPTVVYPYTGTTPAGPDQIRVAALNVENFFPVGINFDGSPVSSEEYQSKRNRIADAVDDLLERPDIVGVAEVYDLAILQDVAAQLGGYTAYLEEGNDDRGIDVGYLVKDSVTATGVTQLGLTATNPTAETCSDIPGALFDRPPLQLDVEALGVSFSVIMNHWSSKAAPDACRDAQAGFVRDQVAAIEAAGGEAIVTGDLNAFEDETPLAVLEDGTTSLDNLWDTVQAGDAYSFQFAGVLQTLDHTLITDGLLAYEPDLQYAHFNTSYYDRELDEATLTGVFDDGHKGSDHDPPVLTLTIGDQPLALCNGLMPTIIGTDGDDVLIGTSGVDVIVGLGGNDVIDGRGGNDVICGGAGDDIIDGGIGADTIFGEAGNDEITGAAGEDTLHGGDGADTIDGGLGADAIFGDAGIDVILGGAGNDTISGGGDSDVIDGELGSDTISGDGGDDTLFGGAGSDTLDGGDDFDRAFGGLGTDSCPASEITRSCES